jgi:DNA-binding transcriptional ArsR family regulator
MPRVATTHDPFNAVAEPKRRQVLDVLAGGDRAVNELVKSLGWPQPQVSKHLGVLKKVGLVSERREGRLHIYRLNGEPLRPIHDWVKKYERFWIHQLERIKARAERKMHDRSGEPRSIPHDQE